MRTSVMEVHDMLSVLSVDEVEQRIGEVPGVESATVNYAAGNATVRFDETRLEIADIRSSVRQRGYGSVAPAAPSAGAHDGHTTPGASPGPSAPTPPKPLTGAPVTADAAASTAQPGQPAAAAAPSVHEGGSEKSIGGHSVHSE